MSLVMMLDQTIEECAELIVACEKLKRNIVPGNPTPVTKDEAIASVTEEIADVNVCMVKVMMELNISADDVVDTMRWKAMRAQERMEGSDVSHCE